MNTKYYNGKAKRAISQARVWFVLGHVENAFSCLSAARDYIARAALARRGVRS